MTGVPLWFLAFFLLSCYCAEAKKKGPPESAGDRVQRMHQEHNAKKREEWNNQFLSTNKVKNSRNQQARLKSHNKNLKKAQRVEESKSGRKEKKLKEFGEKFKRDRGEL